MTAPPVEIVNRQRLAELAGSYEADIVRFLRDLIAIPAESGQEGPVIARIREEMEKAGFDEVRIDPMGNILGRIGSGGTSRDARSSPCKVAQTTAIYLSSQTSSKREPL